MKLFNKGNLLPLFDEIKITPICPYRLIYSLASKISSSRFYRISEYLKLLIIDPIRVWNFSNLRPKFKIFHIYSLTTQWNKIFFKSFQMKEKLLKEQLWRSKVVNFSVVWIYWRYKKQLFISISRIDEHLAQRTIFGLHCFLRLVKQKNFDDKHWQVSSLILSHL